VHDLSIFGPLKKYFRSSISDYAREKGIEIKLRNLPEILEEPWVLANNPLNIKKGFQKAGIWPLNINWVEENLEKLTLFKKKSKEDQFQEMNEAREENGQLKTILKGLDYLDLANKLPEMTISNKPHQLKRTFSNILSQSKSALEDSILKKTVPRKNCVGEFYEDSKILNEQERLVALKMAIDLRNLKKNNQVQKKTQSSQSNQSSLNPKVRKYDAFVQSQQTDLEEEISYKKLKFTQ